MHLKETGREVVDWMHLSQQGTVGGSFEHSMNPRV